MARYKAAIASLICERLAAGESLRAICGPDREAELPGLTTAYQWLADRPKFRVQYQLARDAQADRIIEDILRIANDGAGSAKEKLQIDTLKWVAAKLAPKRYGDAKAVAADTPAPETKPLRFPDDAARAARIVAILAEAGLDADAVEG